MKFTFDIEEIKQIYRAGISRGQEEECAYQCGSRTMNKEFDYCINALYDMLNEGKNWNDENWIHIEKIESWFK